MIHGVPYFSLTHSSRAGKVIVTTCTGELTMALKVEIKDNKLFIEIDLEKPTPSSSGKPLSSRARMGILLPPPKWMVSLLLWG
jgi:hypothetical protein